MRGVLRVAALAWLLAACATPPRPPSFPSASQAASAYRQSIDLAGRISLRYQQSEREEAVHGSFDWSQTPAQTRVTLFSPLGQTIAIIDITPQGARLTQAGGATRSADSPDALAAALGWPLPVAGLRDWLQGFAIDRQGQPWSAYAQATPAEVITRDGWQIVYPNWQTADVPGAPGHPKRIDLTRTTAETGTVAIRIVLDRWQPQP